MKIRDYLKKHKLIIDGAMGTYYGMIENNDNAISELANKTAPNKIESIHREYIRAGAKLIRTNTFATSEEVLKIDREELGDIIRNAYNIAKAAVKAEKDSSGENKEYQVYIAGDIGPIPENSNSNEEEVLLEYKYMVDIFIEEKAEVILFETFSDLKYILPLVKYIKEKDKEVFVITNFCMNKNGYTSSGFSIKKLLEELSIIDEIDACGFNCGIGSGHMYENLKKLPFPKNKYIVSMPNAGYPEQLQNRMIFTDNVNYFENNLRQIAELGIDMIGGCCGTTPEYIKALHKHINLDKTGRGIRISFKPQDKVTKEVYPNEFYDLFSTGRKVIAVELDPPFDANYDKMIQCAHEIKKNGADIITIADSPMGRSRADSILMSIKIGREVKIPVMPHVCCRDRNMIAMRSSLIGAYINDVRNLLVVTGDPVPTVSRLSTTGVFDYNSIQLMSFINEMNEEHFMEAPIYFGGALNYGRGSIDKVIERMKKKIDMGAKYFLTQPIFSKDDIERIKCIKEQIDTKILCGIMPLVSFRNANFVKNEITGINVPDEIVERYHPDMSKEEAEMVGATIANEIIKDLNPFADGYYFMLPFNRTSLLNKIVIS